VIAYLERLAAALLARDPEEIRRLLAAAEGRSLPATVRREALAIARDGGAGRRTPLQALHFLHRTRQLHEGLPRSPGLVATPPSTTTERGARARAAPAGRPASRPASRAAAPLDEAGVAASPEG
jgi:hypothetical protein